MEVVEDEAHEAQVAPLVEDDGHDKLWVEPLLHKLFKETCLEEQQRHKYCNDRIHLRKWNCVVEVVEVDLKFFSKAMYKCGSALRQRFWDWFQFQHFRFGLSSGIHSAALRIHWYLFNPSWMMLGGAPAALHLCNGLAVDDYT